MNYIVGNWYANKCGNRIYFVTSFIDSPYGVRFYEWTDGLNRWFVGEQHLCDQNFALHFLSRDATFAEIQKCKMPYPWIQQVVVSPIVIGSMLGPDLIPEVPMIPLKKECWCGIGIFRSY